MRIREAESLRRMAQLLSVEQGFEPRQWVPLPSEDPW